MRLIAGPCLIESRDHCLKMAEALARITDDLGISKFIFKASWKKANRTRHDSPGNVINPSHAREIFRELDGRMDIITDVHECWHVSELDTFVDAFQIPAFLCRQTDLIQEAGNNVWGINLKRGQFVAPQDVRYMVDKVRAVNPRSHVMVTERGYTFGYNNLVVDFRSIPIMKETSGADEILFDCTHSVQLPGALGKSSGGQREYIEGLARAAIVNGADGLFCEVHDDPSNALSDGPCQIPLHHFRGFLERMLELYAWQKQNPLSSFPLA